MKTLIAVLAVMTVAASARAEVPAALAQLIGQANAQALAKVETPAAKPVKDKTEPKPIGLPEGLGAWKVSRNIDGSVSFHYPRIVYAGEHRYLTPGMMTTDFFCQKAGYSGTFQAVPVASVNDSVMMVSANKDGKLSLVRSDYLVEILTCNK